MKDILDASLHLGDKKKWHPVLAAFLSAAMPGLGQLYKGQYVTALVWLILVTFFIPVLFIPGCVLYVLCIICASSGDPYEIPPGFSGAGRWVCEQPPRGAHAGLHH